jgi:hypothetical protein
MPWVARLENADRTQYMIVQIQTCPEKEARRLAERQNLKFAEAYDRDPYTLVSLEKVRKHGS